MSVNDEIDTTVSIQLLKRYRFYSTQTQDTEGGSSVGSVVKAEKEKDARKRCKQAGTGKSHGGRKTGWEGVEQDSGVKIDFDLRPALEVSML